MTVYDLIPLNSLSRGQSARVDQVIGLPDQVHRLEELGIRSGAEVQMVEPGGACIVRLAGGKLCFRADELLRVLVRPGASV